MSARSRKEYILTVALRPVAMRMAAAHAAPAVDEIDAAANPEAAELLRLFRHHGARPDDRVRVKLPLVAATSFSVQMKEIAKCWAVDGGIANYDRARNFSVPSVKVTGIEALSRILTELQGEPSSCVVRGRFVGWKEAARRESEVSLKNKTTVRRGTVFADQPLHALMIDADGFRPSVDPIVDPVAAIEEFIRTQLPEAFRGCSYHWQLSSSAGHPKSLGGATGSPVADGA